MYYCKKISLHHVKIILILYNVYMVVNVHPLQQVKNPLKIK